MSAEAVARPVEKGLASKVVGFALSLVIVLGLAVLANRLTHWAPAALEYPLWAAVLGLLANLVITITGIREKINQAFRTELYLKTGLVLMGAGLNFMAILAIGARGIIQAGIMVTSVFLFTWYLSRLFGLDKKLRAVMSASVSICGVSAAIAAAGSVLAKKEHLAYVIALVLLFALPLMVIQPYLAKAIGLSPEVAGAWIGGNIDTTAAVVGAGAIHSDTAMKVASVVKMSQNALIGLAAFLLALYWVVKVERKPEDKPKAIEIWHRFPKFVLGFVIASLIATIGLLGPGDIKAAGSLRNWFLTLAFVSIGLELNFKEFGRVGGKPLLVYGMATLFNTGLALGVAWWLFHQA